MSNDETRRRQHEDLGPPDVMLKVALWQEGALSPVITNFEATPVHETDLYGAIGDLLGRAVAASTLEAGPESEMTVEERLNFAIEVAAQQADHAAYRDLPKIKLLYAPGRDDEP